MKGKEDFEVHPCAVDFTLQSADGLVSYDIEFEHFPDSSIPPTRCIRCGEILTPKESIN